MKSNKNLYFCQDVAKNSRRGRLALTRKYFTSIKVLWVFVYLKLVTVLKDVAHNQGIGAYINIIFLTHAIQLLDKGVTLAQLVKASVGQADVQRFESHLGHNWLSCGVFLVKSRARHFGLPLAQTIRLVI